MLLNSQRHEFVVFLFAASSCTYLFCHQGASNCFKTVMNDVCTYFATFCLHPNVLDVKMPSACLFLRCGERRYRTPFVCVLSKIIHCFSRSRCRYKMIVQFHFAFCRLAILKLSKCLPNTLIRTADLAVPSPSIGSTHPRRAS